MTLVLLMVACGGGTDIGGTMAYSLYLERDPPLQLEEWLRVVDGNEALHRADGPIEVTNPKTGEVIRMEGQPGDALATATQLRWFGMTQTTHELGRLSWLDGRVLLPPFDPMKRDSIAVQVFAGVASELGASVVGDEGETYEL